jgi:hypothetical protein
VSVVGRVKLLSNQVRLIMTGRVLKRFEESTFTHMLFLGESQPDKPMDVREAVASMCLM